MKAIVEAFFDPTTFTFSYVVSDPATSKAAIIDSVYDFDPVSGQLDTASAEKILEYVRREGLEIQWVLDTHVHADHLSASHLLQQKIGGTTGIGCEIGAVQTVFGDLFNVEPSFATDGSQFDKLFSDNERFMVGELEVAVLHTPGHTPACVTYLFEGFAFIGDTLFMPDYGTARTDFPGGDAAVLYRSIQRILELPEDTLLYMCHDYGTEQRSEFKHLTSVSLEREHNIHVHAGTSEAEFVAFREGRDAILSAPRLLYPAVQFNMRGGRLPPAESNDRHYFKIPLRIP